MLTTYHCEEELTGPKGLFFQLKNNGFSHTNKPLLIIFNSNLDVDEINKNFINQDTDIIKISINPEIMPLSCDLHQAKCIVWHKYLDQLNLSDLQAAVNMYQVYQKPVVYFVNSYSFQDISELAQEYINENFQQINYIPHREG